MNEPAAEPLSTAEVDNLRDGDTITVIWSGGNGPHKYTIAIDEHGQRYAATKDPAFRFYNPLTFVGREKFHTRVWLRSES